MADVNASKHLPSMGAKFGSLHDRGPAFDTSGFKKESRRVSIVASLGQVEIMTAHYLVGDIIDGVEWRGPEDI